MDKAKIHVFLGAPPPSSALGPVCDAGPEERRDPPPASPWRSVALRWQAGKLQRATGEGFTAEDEEDDGEADQLTQSLPPGQDDRSRAAVADPSSSEAGGRPRGSRSGPPKATAPGGRDDESSADGEEDVCVASVHDYLDGCFPTTPRPPPVSLHTEYLSAWTVGQALVLRAGQRGRSAASPESARPPRRLATPPSTPSSSRTPELFSPVVSPSPGQHVSPQPGSMDLFSQQPFSQRMEEGGVVLEATPDGVLCSQGSGTLEGAGGVKSNQTTTRQSSPTPLHSPAKPTTQKTTQAHPECTRASTSAGRSLHGPTTLLGQCAGPGRRYVVLVVAVHPCHLKEIKVKSGVWAGRSVPLASIVVTDQSGVEMKVVLWRRSAFWALTVYPGDILLITGLEVNHDKWRGETVLQSTYTSRLLNLGQLSTTTSPPAPQGVDRGTLNSLCGFVREQRPLLVCLPHRVPQNLDSLSYVRLRSLRTHTLVHAMLRVTHCHTCTDWRVQAEGASRSGGVQKAVLTVEQGDGHQGALVLWGSALSWLQRINRNRAAVWDFRFLLVRDSVTSEFPELHSTPWGAVQPVFPEESRAREFCRPPGAEPPTGCPELDLGTLLSQRYTGEAELRVNIAAFQFEAGPSQDAAPPPLDAVSSLEQVLETLGGDVTYAGCGRCAVELGTDPNGIYVPCYPCLPLTSVKRYYRPAVLTVKQGSSQVCVHVTPVLLEKILLDTPADRLNKTVARGSEVRHIRLVAERIQSLVSRPRKTFRLTVRSQFVCDENSVPLVEDFLLLDFQVLGE